MNCKGLGHRITYEGFSSVECDMPGCENYKPPSAPEPAGGWGHSKPWFAGLLGSGLLGAGSFEASELGYARAPIAFGFAETDSHGEVFIANNSAVQFPVAREPWLAGRPATHIGIFKSFTGDGLVARIPLVTIHLVVRAGDAPKFAPKALRVFMSMLEPDALDEALRL